MEQMKLAMPTICSRSSHKYYRESGTHTGCPFCLQGDVVLLRQHLQRIHGLLNVMKGEIDAASRL